jgi:hypothetical protein
MFQLSPQDQSTYGFYANTSQLWALASNLHIPTLQNSTLKVIEHISLKFNCIPIWCLHSVYNNTKPGSALRRFFVELISAKMDETSMEELADDLPHRLLLDMAMFQAANRMVDVSFEAEDYFISVDSDGA